MKMPDNKVESVLQYFHNKLDALHLPQEVDSFFWIILESETGWVRLDVMKDPDLRVSESQLLTFIAHTRRLAKFEPVQYIVGESHFMDLKLKVDKSVLIPRPETEELVNWVIDSVNGSKNLEIIDVGTGSGCIALALKYRLVDAYVKGIDIMRNALEVAEFNGKRNNLTVDWQMMDALNMPRDFHKYDVVVSNPPYVLESEKDQMQPNVLEYEPHTALFVEDTDPMLYYEAIAEWASRSLKPKGLLFFEINEKYEQETIDLLIGFDFVSVEAKKDIFDKSRMIKAVR